MSQDTKTVKQLRSELKSLIHNVVQNLPETLKGLEPKERLNVLVRLMPYALPKNDKISATYGEKADFEW